MGTDDFALRGKNIHLEPLQRCHVEGLVAAAGDDTDLYQWSPIPRGKEEATSYVDTALAWKHAGSAIPYAILRVQDGVVIGSTRFFNLEQWAWPPDHPRHNRHFADACEIGYTWFTRTAIRTGANTEAKLLMLRNAFDVWQVLRVCFHTDARNQRSRTALERIGGQFEGILRSHRMAADYIARDSARYSIVAAEWQAVEQRLVRLLDRS